MTFFQQYRYRLEGQKWQPRTGLAKVGERVGGFVSSRPKRKTFDLSHNNGDWQTVPRADVRAQVRGWLAEGKVGEIVEVRAGTNILTIRRVLKRRFPKLPAEAKRDGWTAQHRKAWRGAMVRGAEWWGTHVCRMSRHDSGYPSDHAFTDKNDGCSADDFGFPEADDPKSKDRKRGDAVVKWLREKFHPSLIVWQDGGLHDNHSHVRYNKRPANKPRCMR